MVTEKDFQELRPDMETGSNFVWKTDFLTSENISREKARLMQVAIVAQTAKTLAKFGFGDQGVSIQDFVLFSVEPVELSRQRHSDLEVIIPPHFLVYCPDERMQAKIGDIKRIPTESHSGQGFYFDLGSVLRGRHYGVGFAGFGFNSHNEAFLKREGEWGLFWTSRAGVQTFPFKARRFPVGPKQRRKKGGVGIFIPLLYSQHTEIGDKVNIMPVLLPPNYCSVFGNDNLPLSLDWTDFPENKTEELAQSLRCEPGKAMERLQDILQKRVEFFQSHGQAHFQGNMNKKVAIRLKEGRLVLTLKGLSKSLLSGFSRGRPDLYLSSLPLMFVDDEAKLAINEVKEEAEKDPEQKWRVKAVKQQYQDQSSIASFDLDLIIAHKAGSNLLLGLSYADESLDEALSRLQADPSFTSQCELIIAQLVLGLRKTY